MLLLELPLDILTVIFEDCLLQWGLWHAVRHRLVNRFFDRQIRSAMCTTRYLERYTDKSNYYVGRALQTQYMEYLVKIGNPGGVNLARAVQECLHLLGANDEPGVVDSTARRRRILCKEVLKRHGYHGWHWLSCKPIDEQVLNSHYLEHRILENTELTAGLLCGEVVFDPKLPPDEQLLSASNSFFGTPLECAAVSGLLDQVRLLLGIGVKDAVKCRSALKVAAARGHNAIVQALLNADVDCSIYGSELKALDIVISSAVGGGQLSTIDSFLTETVAGKLGVAMKEYLYRAASSGREGLVRLLLPHSMDCPEPMGAGMRFHVSALSSRNPKTTKALMDHLPFSQSTFRRAARRTAENGRLNALQYIHTRCSIGYLHGSLTDAARNGQHCTITYMLTHLSPPSDDVCAALESAASRGFDSIIRLLYRYGSEIMDPRSLGGALLQALTAARIHRHLNVVHTLTELSVGVLPGLEPGVVKEINDLVENKRLVDAPKSWSQASSPLCQAFSRD